jgi:HSP20 family protein
MENFMTTLPSRLSRQHPENFNHPWGAFKDLRTELTNLLGKQDPSEEYNGLNFVPTCDLKENNKEYIFKFDIPGVNKADIKIEVENNGLTVHGERIEQKEESDEKHHLSETYSGSFMRSFKIPHKFDEDNVDAAYKNGILTIKVPKVEHSKIKKIEIY